MQLESLRKSLETIVVAYEEHLKDKDNALVRDAVVKRYEYTYETALKIIRRSLIETILANENVNALSFNDFIRTANGAGLLENNLQQWQSYRQQRNAASHTYNEIKAEELLKILPEFISEMKFLLNRLSKTCKQN